MRIIFPLAFALVLAGCASSPRSPADPNFAQAAGADRAPDAPWHSEGTVWLAPTSGNSRGVLTLNFTVNSTGPGGANVSALVRIGEKWFAELPNSIASVDAKLVDASGKELAKAARELGGPTQLKLEAKDAAPGAGRLVISYRGGSDQGQGGGMGEYVAFTIDAS